MRLSIILALLALLLAGCSNRQAYNAIQGNRQFECGKLPQRQYEECMAEYAESYEDYQREREALLEDDPPGEVVTERATAP